MLKIRNLLYLLIITLLSSCYYGSSDKTSVVTFDSDHADSLHFRTSHHYGINYNFIVTSDSLALKHSIQTDFEYINRDSMMVYHDDRIVVADVSIVPDDVVDSVWIKVARDQSTMGWLHEKVLLKSVVPDDPISQFIDTFSDTHLLIFLIIIGGMSAIYYIRTLVRRKAKIVHFNDISTPYPTILAVIVASSATFYASIQMFAPDTWQHFYYNPTLNPFAVPPILSVFLVSVWALLVVGIATIDEVRKYLPFGEAILYLFGLLGICAVDYIVFSVSTLYYVGYVLLIAYIFYAFYTYFKNVKRSYICGNCGARLTHKGICPECGAYNK